MWNFLSFLFYCSIAARLAAAASSQDSRILDLLSPQLEDTGLKTTTFLQHFKDVVTTKFNGRDHHLPPLHPAHPAHQQSALHHHHQPHQAVAQSFSTIFPTYLGMDRAAAGGCGAAGGGLGVVTSSATALGPGGIAGGSGGGIGGGVGNVGGVGVIGGGALNGLEAMSAESTGLCLQDLVSASTANGAGSAGSAESATTTSTALSSGSSTVNGGGSSASGADHLHSHHSLHDSSSSVSISPAISSLMPISSLSHLHHSAAAGQDLVGSYPQHPHHAVVPPHTPKHEPLEKLRSKYRIEESVSAPQSQSRTRIRIRISIFPPPGSLWGPISWPICYSILCILELGCDRSALPLPHSK